MTPDALAVERDRLLEGGRTLEQVERMQRAVAPRLSVFVVTQANSCPWGVFSTLAAAQSCALRACRATLYPDISDFGWESVELERDPRSPDVVDPLIARWRSAPDEEDYCFYVDQMVVDESTIWNTTPPEPIDEYPPDGAG